MSPSSAPNPIRSLNPISDADAAGAVNPQTLADLAEAIVATPAMRRPDRPPGAVGSRRARRWLLPAPLVIGVVAALVVVLTAGESGTSLVSRAYAAISPTGSIVHYVESTTMFLRSGDGPARELQSGRSEVWTAGSRTHVLTTLTDPLNGRAHRHATMEIAIDGNRMTAYATGPYAPGRLLQAPTPSCGSPLGLPRAACGINPVAGLREAYRSGTLHAAGQTMLGGHRVDVLTGRVHFPRAVLQNVRVFIDPRTFVPLEIQTTSSGRLQGGPLNGRPWLETTISTFSRYQRLPLTSRNRELLTLRSRP